MSPTDERSRPAGNGPAKESLDHDDIGILSRSADNSDSGTGDVVLDRPSIRFVREMFMEAGAEAMMFSLLNAGRELSTEAARTVWQHLRFAEIAEQRRVDHEPCPTRCRRCSRCIHSLAYWGRGGRDRLGQADEEPVSADWEPRPTSRDRGADRQGISSTVLERHLRVVPEAS